MDNKGYDRYIARENRRTERRPPTIWGCAVALGVSLLLWLGILATGALGVLLYNSCPPGVWVLLVTAMVGTAGTVGYISGKGK